MFLKLNYVQKTKILYHILCHAILKVLNNEFFTFMVQDYVMRFKCCEFYADGISHVLFDIGEQ